MYMNQMAIVVSRTSALERGVVDSRGNLKIISNEELTSLLTTAKYILVQTGRNVLDQPYGNVLISTPQYIVKVRA